MKPAGDLCPSRFWLSSCLTAVMLAIGFLSFEAPVAAADDEKKKDDEVPALEAEAIGEPPSYRKPIEGATFYVWRIGDQFHVHTKTKSQKHEFKGKIAVKGGKVTKISDFRNLEANVKKKKGVTRAADDVGRLNGAKNEIEFKFHTSGKEDNFAFTVDKNVETVTFDLKLDGNHKKKQINIGGKDTHPANVPFVVAMPAKEQPTNDSGETKEETKDEAKSDDKNEL